MTERPEITKNDEAIDHIYDTALERFDSGQPSRGILRTSKEILEILGARAKARHLAALERDAPEPEYAPRPPDEQPRRPRGRSAKKDKPKPARRRKRGPKPGIGQTVLFTP